MSYETDKWPIIKAKWFTPVAGIRNVRVIVVHAMQFQEVPNAAEIIAHDFATRPATNKASAHLCIDSDSIVQCVMDNDVAYAAPGCNNDGIHLELAGFTEQSAAQWADAYSRATIARAADAAAQYCLKYALPLTHLTNNELKAGRRGIVGHYQVSQVYKKSDHTDPGPSFPWGDFMRLVAEAYARRKKT